MIQKIEYIYEVAESSWLMFTHATNTFTQLNSKIKCGG